MPQTIFAPRSYACKKKKLRSLRGIQDSLVAQRLKGLPAMWETWVQSLDREDPLEKEMATHSSTLAWRIPWTEDLGRLQSTGRKELDTTEQLHFHLSFSVGLTSLSMIISRSIHVAANGIISFLMAE